MINANMVIEVFTQFDHFASQDFYFLAFWNSDLNKILIPCHL